MKKKEKTIIRIFVKLKKNNIKRKHPFRFKNEKFLGFKKTSPDDNDFIIKTLPFEKKFTGVSYTSDYTPVKRISLWRRIIKKIFNKK